MTRQTLWHEAANRAETDGTAVPSRVEVAVVGAGITGLTTAVLLARAGLSVAVLEARTVAGSTTGASTAKVSLLQGTTFSTIARHHPPSVIGTYVEANRAAQEWLSGFCETAGVPVQSRDAVTFAVSDQGERQARQELALARDAGLPVTWVPELDLPFGHRGGVQLSEQLQTDPVAVAHALVREARAHGATVHEGVRALRVSGDQPALIETDSGVVQADRVVLATGMPILDRGGYFARMEARRSYLMAFRGVVAPPSGMYLSAEQPSRSLREARRGDDKLLLVGGAGHTTGRTRSEREHLDQLRDWTRRWWPQAEETHAWSAQDHSTSHGLPFAGPLQPGTEHLLVAGGFAKWGMTNGVAGAMALAARVTGGRLDWAAIYEPWRRSELAGLGTFARFNASVAVEMARGWMRLDAAHRAEPAAAPDGLSRVCTHLGGKVKWNDAEQTWDCPLHGSRFDADGTVLNAPATCGLRRASTE
ncbi:FAD-dependent oxidoreductase [Pseudactinotalea suaedae]|uniref:FAD-dependent oxidoreductase n=1 Tax=Pseudactinotalea suaedae TaxID=1524924 RepID=UPI0012E17F20|nr:FAD-dependent oxidoreductase [Pseudactinotalea suaedae]